MSNRRMKVWVAALAGGWSATVGGAQEAATDHAATTRLDGRGGGVIAYSKQPGPGSGVHEIFTINADGTGDRKLIDAPLGLNHQAWAPTAERLVAVGYVSESTWSLYGFRSDGSGLLRLTHTSGVWDTEPAWSPDGSRIAFTRMYPSRNGRSELWLMNADGTDQHALGVEGFGARWSPDGTQFVFASNKGGNWELYVCAADGTNESRLTTTPADEMSPVWSPAGAEIAFTSNADGDHEIVVMASDGSHRRRLTDNVSDEHYPAWSPDGSLIAFQSDLPGRGHFELYVMDADGAHSRRVTHTPPPRTAIAPAWRPPGPPDD
jgi:Tol biopolymer transport system component